MLQLKWRYIPTSTFPYKDDSAPSAVKERISDVFIMRQCLHACKQEPYGQNRESLSLSTYEVFIKSSTDWILLFKLHHYGLELTWSCVINGARIVLKLRILHDEKLNGCQDLVQFSMKCKLVLVSHPKGCLSK